MNSNKKQRQIKLSNSSMLAIQNPSVQHQMIQAKKEEALKDFTIQKQNLNDC